MRFCSLSHEELQDFKRKGKKYLLPPSPLIPTLIGMFISILQRRKLSVREVRSLAPDHAANKQSLIPKCSEPLSHRLRVRVRQARDWVFAVWELSEHGNLEAPGRQACTETWCPCRWPRPRQQAAPGPLGLPGSVSLLAILGAGQGRLQ